MTLTLPTWLTLLRIALIPILVLVFYLPFTWTPAASSNPRRLAHFWIPSPTN